MAQRTASTTSRLTLVALTATIAFALSACAAAAPAPGPTSQPPASDVPVGSVTANDASAEPIASPEPVIPVPAQLQFTATTVVSGEAFDGTDLAGRSTVLWFWAPWCPVCQAESSTVVEALAELPDGVELIGVAGQSDVASMQGFVDKYGVGGFEHVADVDGAVWSGFGVPYQPAFAFIGEDGSVRTIVSPLSKAEIRAGANELVS